MPPSNLFARFGRVDVFRRFLAARTSSKLKKTTEDLDPALQPKVKKEKAASESSQNKTKKEKAASESTSKVKKEKPVPVVISEPAPPPIIPFPQIQSQNNILLNFPLFADSKAPKIAAILAHDRVVEHGLKRYPSVGTVMRDTQTPQQIFLLNRWREKKTVELGGVAEFNQYVQRIKSEGERLHNCLRLFLSSELPEKDLPLVDALVPLWTSFRPVLDKISTVCAVETTVHHRPLGYTGIADCIAEIDGELVVIDWKVSERQRTNLAQTYDTPIQIIAYIGALNAHFALNELKKTNPPAPALLPTKDGKKQETPHQLFVPRKMIRHGLAVIGYRDGSPAHIHVMDEKACESYWLKWLEKVHMFWIKKLSSTNNNNDNNKNSSTPAQHNPL